MSQIVKHGGGCLYQIIMAYSAKTELALLSGDFEDLVNHALENAALVCIAVWF